MLNGSAKGTLGLCFTLASWVLLRPTEVLTHSVKCSDPKNIKVSIKKTNKQTIQQPKTSQN